MKAIVRKRWGTGSGRLPQPAATARSKPSRSNGHPHPARKPESFCRQPADSIVLAAMISEPFRRFRYPLYEYLRKFD
jgi:hypothetical protein